MKIWILGSSVCLINACSILLWSTNNAEAAACTSPRVDNEVIVADTVSGTCTGTVDTNPGVKFTFTDVPNFDVFPNPTNVTMRASTCAGAGCVAANVSACSVAGGACAVTVTFTNDADGVVSILNYNVPAGVNRAENITVTGGAFDIVAAPGGGPTTSINLTSQQQTFTSQAMNQTAQNLGDAMTQNIQGQFSDTGAFNVASNRFFIQSAGMQNWLYRRRKEIIDKERAIVMRARKRRLPSKKADPDIIEADNTTILPAASYPSSSKAPPMFNAWAKGMFTYYDGRGSSFDGSLIDLMVGVDYKITQYFLVGLLGGYNNADFDTLTAGTAGTFKADGFSVGPYLGVKLTDKVIFDALIAYTRSNYDNSSGAVTGDFNANRVTFAANLTGTWDLPYALFIEPSIGISYASEKQLNYIDSAAIAHASTTIRAGRLSIGPKIGKGFKIDSGTLTPWAGAYLVYDFSNAGNTPGSGLPDLGDITSARIAAGLNAALQGFTIALTGDVTGIGTSAYTAYRGQVKVNVPF